MKSIDIVFFLVYNFYTFGHLKRRFWALKKYKGLTLKSVKTTDLLSFLSFYVFSEMIVIYFFITTDKKDQVAFVCCRSYALLCSSYSHNYSYLVSNKN